MKAIRHVFAWDYSRESSRDNTHGVYDGGGTRKNPANQGLSKTTKNGIAEIFL